MPEVSSVLNMLSFVQYMMILLHVKSDASTTYCLMWIWLCWLAVHVGCNF